MTLALLGAGGCTIEPVGSGEADFGAQVDEVFAAHASLDGPGCSVGVIHEGELLFGRGYGAANLDYATPNGSRTVFRVGSVSKQFTAGAIALLAIEQQLDLDEPVRTYIPEFPVYDPPPTVRHLVHHTSGVRDYIVLMALAGNRDEDFYTNDEVLDAINRQEELNFTAGSEFLYSNAGYFLLGEIVRRVSGQSLREFSHERFFEPLGMDETHFHDDHNEVVTNRATGYAPTEDGYRINVTTLDMVGDGGVFTTITDWVRWDQNLAHGTVGGQEWLDLMQTRGVLNNGDTIPYAFGIVHGEHGGLPTLSHGGGWVGFRAYMARYPSVDHGFVTLCNGANLNPADLLTRTAEAVLGDRMSEETAGDEASPTPSTPPPEATAVADPSPYTGRYYSRELDVEYDIAVTDDGLTVRMGGRRSGALLERDPGTLVVEGVGVVLRFEGPTDAHSGFQVDAGRVKNLRFVRVSD